MSISGGAQPGIAPDDVLPISTPPGQPIEILTPPGQPAEVITQTEQIAAQIVGASYFVDGLLGGSAPHYLLGIDLDNDVGGTPGPYKHASPGTALGFDIVSVGALLLKARNSDVWEAIWGVILRIDGTDADVAWFQLGNTLAGDTNNFRDRADFSGLPFTVKTQVVGNDLPTQGGGRRENNIAAINTGITLLDAAGVAKTPAEGDVVVLVDRLVGGGGPGTSQARIHLSWFYRSIQP